MRRIVHTVTMSYYNYHAVARRLIKEGKLTGWYITERYHRISPALVLLFDDAAHPVMPIREYRWDDYLPLLHTEKRRTDDFG